MVTWGMLFMQDAGSPLMKGVIDFHDHAMVVLVLVISVVLYMLIYMSCNYCFDNYISEHQGIETVWTVGPALLLVFIAIPSLKLLYVSDEIYNAGLTLKSVGHQWYWSYEYSDFIDVDFDSFMLPDEEQIFRLLDVDNRVVLPWGVSVRVLITAGDVLHSWTVPSMGVKVDAIPGRVNQVLLCVGRPGVYFGQCSEICGANHSFMPIVLEGVSLNSFIDWVSTF
uniref:Cytochrome c oxidase subunit 2 n=1 Tax=Heterometrus longimanus TaxID=1719223 RepID=A0A0U2NG53_9SCOR|nr:cytochrome c oxidase subunit II [Heterometrus longimanus]